MGLECWEWQERLGLVSRSEVLVKYCRCLNPNAATCMCQITLLSEFINLPCPFCCPPADDCLAALAAALPQLATLNLQGCSGLGDEAISHLVNMPNLRRAAEGPTWVGASAWVAGSWVASCYSQSCLPLPGSCLIVRMRSFLGSARTPSEGL